MGESQSKFLRKEFDPGIPIDDDLKNFQEGGDGKERTFMLVPPKEE